MKEMVYQQTRTLAELLDSGNIDGYEYRIISFGTHPCAYIALPKAHKYYNQYKKLYMNSVIKVHGNITYARGELQVEKAKQKNHWLGWDYAHYGDYVGSISNIISADINKKWTTAEILKEVQFVVKQLQKLNK